MQNVHIGDGRTGWRQGLKCYWDNEDGWWHKVDKQTRSPQEPAEDAHCYHGIGRKGRQLGGHHKRGRIEERQRKIPTGPVESIDTVGG